MRHWWTSDLSDPRFASCVCGLRRFGREPGSECKGKIEFYIRDGVEQAEAGDCTRSPLDCSSRNTSKPRMSRLAPFLRGDIKGELARAALPKKPPVRRAAPGEM